MTHSIPPPPPSAQEAAHAYATTKCRVAREIHGGHPDATWGDVREAFLAGHAAATADKGSALLAQVMEWLNPRTPMTKEQVYEALVSAYQRPPAEPPLLPSDNTQSALSTDNRAPPDAYEATARQIVDEGPVTFGARANEHYTRAIAAALSQVAQSARVTALEEAARMARECGAIGTEGAIQSLMSERLPSRPTDEDVARLVGAAKELCDWALAYAHHPDIPAREACEEALRPWREGGPK